MRRDRLQRRMALQQLEAVGRDQHRLGRRVVAVVRPADPLHQALDVLGRAHLDHQVHVAPVDSEVERAGRDHRAQPPLGHRRLDPPAHLARERAVVQADRQAACVLGPERLEEQLRLRPGVDEDEADPVRRDQLHHRRGRMQAARPGPGRRGPGLQDDDVGLGPRIGDQHARAAAEEPGEGGGILDRGREPDPPHPGRQALQPREAERELVAALGFRQRMDLVEHHPGQPAEDPRRLRVGQEQRQRFRRGQQDLRRVHPLARPLRGAGVAAAVLDADREPHLGHGSREVAPDVRGQRLQRRDVERVQPRRRRRPQLDQRGQEPRQRLAPAGRRHQQRGGIGGALQ